MSNSDVASFGFGDGAGLEYVMEIVRNNIYSNKILAVIREYSTNALDSHIESRISHTPIKVTFPTGNDLEFSIRDYGAGLSKTDVFDTYIKFGTSTKRKMALKKDLTVNIDDNNFDELKKTTNSIAGFKGIGCKSGFCYSEKFYVTSYFEGYKYKYLASIEKSKAGTINLLERKKTSEPSGLMVTIPVKQRDVHNFSNIGLKFFSSFDVTPCSNLKIRKRENPCRAGRRWNIYKDNLSSVLKMSNISYEIDQNIISDNRFSEKDRTVLRTRGLELKCDASEVDVTASREILESTDKTIEYIKTLITHISSEFEASILKKFMLCETQFDQVQMVLEELKSSPIKSLSISILSSFIQYGYDHNKIFRYVYHSDLDNFDCKTFVNEQVCYGSFIPSSLGAIIVDDVKSKWKIRTNSLLSNNGVDKRVLVVKKGEMPIKSFVRELGKFLAKIGVLGIPVYYLSDVILKKKKRTKKLRSDNKNILYKKNSSFYYGSRGWAPVGIIADDTVRYYAVIDRFKLSMKTDGLIMAYNRCIKDVEWVGVRSRDVCKLPGNYFPIEEFLTRELSLFEKNHPSREVYVNSEVVRKMKLLPVPCRRYLVNNLESNVYIEMFEKIFEAELFYNKPEFLRLRLVKSVLSLTKGTSTLTDIYQKFLRKNGMINILLNNGGCYSISKSDYKFIADYANSNNSI